MISFWHRTNAVIIGSSMCGPARGRASFDRVVHLDHLPSRRRCDDTLGSADDVEGHTRAAPLLMISMVRRPRKPQRKPEASAAELSG